LVGGLEVQKKLTITIDEEVYEGLYREVGQRRISGFIEALVRPHVTQAGVEAAYREMGAAGEREDEALEWSEALLGDSWNDAER